MVFLAFRPLALSNKSRGENAKNSNFNELLLQTIRLCLCCQEEETLGTSTPALGFLTRQILALSLFALLLHLVFSFSPPPLPLLCFLTADVTQRTATLAIHSEEPATVSNSSLD